MAVCQVVTANGSGINTKEAIEAGVQNAAFIVRACNSHNALLDALKEIKRMTEPEITGAFRQPSHQQIYYHAQAAITKATGAPRFPETFCSQCGEGFGPGDGGVSHCANHKHLKALA